MHQLKKWIWVNISFYNKGVTPDNNSGIIWSSGYHIKRISGVWSSPNYQQLDLHWYSGITLTTGNEHGKSFVGFDNGMFIGSSYYGTKPL